MIGMIVVVLDGSAVFGFVVNYGYYFACNIVCSPDYICLLLLLD